jgi:trehalose 6-phosphate phosphatase
LDFDGTLTPLVDDPGTVYLPDQMQRVLRALAAQPRVTLAVVSGRQRADVQARVGIPGIIYAGNHGLEISGDGFLFVEPQALAYREALEGVALGIGAQLDAIEGAFVEDKGLTLSVHYRQAALACEAAVRRAVEDALAAARQPLSLTVGAMVFEIGPRVHWHKGSALEWIRQRIAQRDVLALFVGDDATDERAFAALKDGITVKVGSSNATAAQYLVESPADVRRFLEWLAELLRAEPAGA